MVVFVNGSNRRIEFVAGGQTIILKRGKSVTASDAAGKEFLSPSFTRPGLRRFVRVEFVVEKVALKTDPDTEEKTLEEQPVVEEPQESVNTEEEKIEEKNTKIKPTEGTRKKSGKSGKSVRFKGKT